MSKTDQNKDTSDIQITKEVFRVKYNPPMYIDLTEISDSESEITHISETCDTAQESGKKTQTKQSNNTISSKICNNTLNPPYTNQICYMHLIQYMLKYQFLSNLSYATQICHIQSHALC